MTRFTSRADGVRSNALGPGAAIPEVSAAFEATGPDRPSTGSTNEAADAVECACINLPTSTSRMAQAGQREAFAELYPATRPGL